MPRPDDGNAPPATESVRNRTSMAAHLAAFEPRALIRTDLTPASVVICVLPGDPGPSLLITRRASRLRAHPGQWALPGGRRDPGESIEQAGLRELAEETGLEVGADTVLGRLDDYETRSGYVMSPIVVWAGTDGDQDADDGAPPPPALAGAQSEVAGVYRIPVADFDVVPQFVSIPESDRPVIRLPLLGGHLHAPTAAIVHQFCEVALHGRPTRVGHYEQPVFAWT